MWPVAKNEIGAGINRGMGEYVDITTLFAEKGFHLKRHVFKVNTFAAAMERYDYHVALLF